jgi:hypothetical protein
VTLKAGDLMLSATPAVVGAAVPGDSILSISTPLTIAIGKPAFFLALIDLPSQPFVKKRYPSPKSEVVAGRLSGRLQMVCAMLSAPKFILRP